MDSVYRYKGCQRCVLWRCGAIKTHECCTSSRTHGHGTVAKLLQLLHHVYSLQIHGYGFDCVCLKMVHTPTWQFVYWKIGDYPLSAVFFWTGYLFFRQTHMLSPKNRSILSPIPIPENPSGMYGQNMFGSDSKCGFHRILFIYHLFEVKFRTEGYLCCVFFFFRGRFWSLFGFLVPWFPASAFHASLLLCFTWFFSFLLLCCPRFSAFVLLCLSTLLLYMFFSLVMCFCCSTSCSFASLLSVFAASLFFLFFCFILSCLYPKWNPKDPRWNQRNPKEILIRTPDKKPYKNPKETLHETLKKP